MTCDVYDLRRKKRERGELTNWIKGKGKTIPLYAWTGREVSRRLKLPDIKIIST